jgi:hypothetical protein
VDKAAGGEGQDQDGVELLAGSASGSGGAAPSMGAGSTAEDVIEIT